MNIGKLHGELRAGIEGGIVGNRARTIRVRTVVAAFLTAWLSLVVAPGGSGVASAASTYYVNGDPSIGKATNTCLSPSSACLTITQALGKATSGDVIDIAGSDNNFKGVYCEQITIDTSLTLQAQSPTNKPAIDGGHGGSSCPAGMPQHSVVTVGDTKGTTMTVVLLRLIIQNGDGLINTNFANAPGEGGGIFVFSGVTMSLTDSTVRYNAGCTAGCSSGTGGGIYSSGNLTLTNSSVTDNFACNPGCNGLGGGVGGGIASGNTLKLINTTVSNNVACSQSCSQDSYGGGVYSVGPLTLTGSTVQSNTACSGSCPASENGGGIAQRYNAATLTNSTVIGNNACFGSSCTGNAYGGGIYIAPSSPSGSAASMTLTASTVKQNTACNGSSCTGNYDYGGGIDNNGTVTLTNSSVTLNSACTGGCAYGYGGGIYSNGTTTLSGSTLGDGNRACNDQCTAGYGGGIYVASGTTNLLSSTVSNNSGCTADGCSGSGGGMFDAATAYLTNSTVADNTACTGTGCSGGGGAIVNNSAMYLTNSTVSANAACSGTSCTGQVGGVDNLGTTATLSNTILAGNTDPTGAYPDCAGGALTDGSYSGLGTVGSNIIGNVTGCSFNAGPGDLVGTSTAPINPELDSLGSYGGPTETMRLQLSSLAHGAGNAALCQYHTSPNAVNNLDQRGSPRHADIRHSCDVGAYDTGSYIQVRLGWNLISIPFYIAGTPGPGSAGSLVSSLDSQLGSSTAIGALATYADDAFHLYVPGYSAEQTLGSNQGLFVLSRMDGEWLPPGTPYTSSQQVNLQPGWNMVAVPYVSSSTPYGGLNGDDIDVALARTCGLQEVATYVNGSYQTYTPGAGPAGTAFHVPSTLGMWIECTKAYAWTP